VDHPTVLHGRRLRCPTPEHSFCLPAVARLPDIGADHNGGYLRVRASVFLTEGDRTSGVEGTHQVLPDTGEFPRRFGVQPPLGHTDR
jgi:hypothetical protein